jgi:hypothetical protein
VRYVMRMLGDGQSGVAKISGWEEGVCSGVSPETIGQPSEVELIDTILVVFVGANGTTRRISRVDTGRFRTSPRRVHERIDYPPRRTI